MSKMCWIFDIDGVITDPKSKKITNPKIINNIVKFLSDGNYVALNTGRSESWINNNLIEKLKKELIKIDNSYQNLINLYSVCEMGNILIEYDKNGGRRKTILNNNIIPNNLSKTIREIVNKVYKNSMFVDETKEVILTIEMRDDFEFSEFKNQQQEFKKEIEIIMRNYHPQLHVKPSSTTIAIDIKPIDSGKGLGASKIIQWLKKSSIDINNLNFVCFGDSKSDFEMSDYLHSQGLHTKLVYVGDSLEVNKDYQVVVTKNKYTEGTLEYLKNISN